MTIKHLSQENEFGDHAFEHVGAVRRSRARYEDVLRTEENREIVVACRIRQDAAERAEHGVALPKDCATLRHPGIETIRQPDEIRREARGWPEINVARPA